MKRLLLAALFALGLAAPAFGQTVIVTSCPSATGVGGSAGSTGRPYAIDVNGNVCFIGSAVPVPSAEAGAGITPVVSSALESNHVIKAAAGNLYSAYVTTGAVAGWFLVANSTTAPTAGGAAIAPLVCVVAPINSTTSISYPDNAPLVASTGITLVFSTSGCLTNTASTTVFFSGSAK